ncbi:MAG: right-handed parallel beta-helix repeat-containing protein [Phycisphaerales bacterium]|nr:right-handed parallel beta-helix repeat-containing protein [Phycisphaerales bacterium]
MIELIALSVVMGAAVAEPPTLVVRADNTRVTESCRVVVPEGLVIEDADGDGVLHIEADGVTVEFAPGEGTLRGAPEDAPYETLAGVGVRIDGRRGVTIRRAALRGFKVGVWATGADGLVIEDCDVSRGYAMRLGSTPLAEDGADWLWPHQNDKGEWRERYGAGLYVEQSEGVTIRRVRARERQNGIVVDRLYQSRIYDNDCSFLSGWGLAMWRCNDNVICRNAFDFCIRGYAHGVYNRGQDSAGILVFEQNNRNRFIENSATHGGDGFFGFGGREALGEGELPMGFSCARKGNNDNLFVGNAFSYAAAHGLELTFSFGNVIEGNTFDSNAICGIWGGYSQDTIIRGNAFSDNGTAGYGLERGGINIEHGAGNLVQGNTFAGDVCGVHYWVDEDAGLRELPWAKANYRGAVDNVIAGNAFSRVGTAVQLRGEVTGTVISDNAYAGVEKELDAPEGLEISSAVPALPAPAAIPSGIVVGERRPIEARREFAGRENIIMGEYFPWDFEAPMLRVRSMGPGEHVFEVFGAAPGGVRAEATTPAGSVTCTVEAAPKGAGRHVPVVVRIIAGAGVTPYALTVRAGKASWERTGAIIGIEWHVRTFAWTIDPRENEEGWRAEGAGAEARTLPSLNLAYQHAGPKAMGFADAGTDKFGTLASGKVRLGPGTWRIRTLSDDGVRVRVDGAAVIENWTWHGPQSDEGEFTLTEGREVEIEVEHFELDGYAVLTLDIELVREE